MDAVTAHCADCGAEIHFPEPANPAARELLRGRRAYCDGCLERLAAEEERQRAAEREREAAKAAEEVSAVSMIVTAG